MNRELQNQAINNIMNSIQFMMSDVDKKAIKTEAVSLVTHLEEIGVTQAEAEVLVEFARQKLIDDNSNIEDEPDDIFDDSDDENFED